MTARFRVRRAILLRKGEYPMRLFIGWSGSTSRAVAKALRDWLPLVLQSIKPWMSEEDIDAGKRWGAEIENQLDRAEFGIVCLTPENLDSTWLHFEAGALAKKVDKAYLCPYLMRVAPADIKGPLARFQYKRADEDGTRDLLFAINRCLKEESVGDEVAKKLFEKWWPDLSEVFERIPETVDAKVKRPPEELIEEVLEIVRSLDRRFPNLPPRPPGAATRATMGSTSGDLASLGSVSFDRGESFINLVEAAEHLPESLQRDLRALVKKKPE